MSTEDPIAVNPHCLFAGRTTLDALYWLETMPQEDTKVYARHFKAAPGGPALNAAITHALLGGSTQLVSAVGVGPWAEVVRTSLEVNKIGLLDLAAGTNYETPLCAVLVDAARANRTIVNPPLAEVKLRRLGSWQQESCILGGELPAVALTDGFFFDSVSALLTSLRDEGVAICLDGGSWKPGTEELARLLSVAICSERFCPPTESGGAEAIFAFFAAKGVRNIAVTRGAKSILGWEGGRRFEIEIPRVDVVDTLGAGDVLHGAFSYFFAQEPRFEAALRQGAEIATLSCQSLGTQAWREGLLSRPPNP